MAEKKLLTGKNILIAGGVGIIAYFLFSKPAGVTAGGGGTSVFESIREMGGSVKEVFQSTKEVLSETVGFAGDVLGGVGTGLAEVGTGVKVARTGAPAMIGIAGTPSLIKKEIRPSFGGGFVRLGGTLGGGVDVVQGTIIQLSKAKTKKEDKTEALPTPIKRDIPKGIFEVFKTSLRGGGVPFVPFI